MDTLCRVRTSRGWAGSHGLNRNTRHQTEARRRMQAKIQISERKEVKASGHTFILVPDPKHPGRHTLTIKPTALDTEQKQAKT